MMQEVEKYSKATRLLHWVHAGAFIVLFITGLILFVPGLNVMAHGGWTRLIHRIAVGFFVIAPLIYVPLNWRATVRGIKDAFTWGKADIGWIKAFPRYYFLCDEECMPPQGHMNTGQKAWWAMVLIFGVVFGVSGLIMWLLADSTPNELRQWMVIVHDLAFIATGLMLFVHIYMSVIHPIVRPLNSGAWSSMWRGKVSSEYAKSHHSKWYAEISGETETGKGK